MRPETPPPAPPLRGEGGQTPAPPSLSGKGAGGLGCRLLHAAAFAALLAVWTYLLLRPNPVPESLFTGFSWFDKEMLVFVLAKCAHLGVYAVLAVFGGSLVPAGRRRLAVFALLVLHGAASELGQWVGNTYYGTNRFGTPRDVLIDAAGIAAGAYALRRWGRVTPRSR